MQAFVYPEVDVEYIDERSTGEIEREVMRMGQQGLSGAIRPMVDHRTRLWRAMVIG